MKFMARRRQKPPTIIIMSPIDTLIVYSDLHDAGPPIFREKDHP